MYILINFYYEEGWMMLLYKDNENIKYWCGDEHYQDNVWDYIYLLKENNEVEIVEPKVITFDDVNNLKMDIFSLSKEDIEKLRSLQ